MKISARNQLKGTIVDVVKGATTSHIRIDVCRADHCHGFDHHRIGGRAEARRGADRLCAVIKASDVMVGVE